MSYSIDDLLHLVHSDGADELRLYVRQAPVIVLDDEQHAVEGLALTSEDAESLLQSITDTRQRRELRERGAVEFVYRFRNRATFVVRAKIEGGNIEINIH